MFEPLFLTLAAIWAFSLFFVGSIRYRGVRTWPWSLALWFVSVTVFAVAVYSGPEPDNCSLF